MCAVRGVCRTEANTDEVVRVQEKTETKKPPPSPAWHAGCCFRRDRGAALNNAISPPHQLARQRFNRVPEALVAGHVEQLVNDLLQRSRINVVAEGLREF